MVNPQHDREGRDLEWLAFRYVAGELTAEEADRFEAQLAVDQRACEAVAATVKLAEVAAVVERHTRSLGELSRGGSGPAVTSSATSQNGSSPETSVAETSVSSRGGAGDLGRGATGGERRARLGWSRRLAWMGFGAAACLLVVLTIQSASPRYFPSARNHELAHGTRSEPSTSAHPATSHPGTAAEPGSEGNAAPVLPRSPSPELALVWAQSRTTLVVSPSGDDFDGRADGGEREGSDGLDFTGIDVSEIDFGEEGFTAPSWMVAAVAGLDESTEMSN